MSSVTRTLESPHLRGAPVVAVAAAIGELLHPRRLSLDRHRMTDRVPMGVQIVLPPDLNHLGASFAPLLVRSNVIETLEAHVAAR